jgi:hypothetical protein
VSRAATGSKLSGIAVVVSYSIAIPGHVTPPVPTFKVDVNEPDVPLAVRYELFPKYPAFAAVIVYSLALTSVNVARPYVPPDLTAAY